MIANLAPADTHSSFAIDRRNPIAGNAREEIAMMALDERGTILDCNLATENLFAYNRHEMVWRHVSMLLPQLECVDLMRHGEINPRLRFLCRSGLDYRARKKNGDGFASKLYFNCVDSTAGRGDLLLIVRPAERAGQPVAATVA